jgi:DNA invertase Pin-like site-specific DNA recombinase
MTTLPAAAGAAGAANSPGIAYLRDATAAAEEPDVPFKEQRAVIEAWAERHSVRIVAWFEDRGVSGLSGLARRPGLSAALAWMKVERAEALIVARWDRVARDPHLIDAIEAAVQQAGGRIVCAADEGVTDCADDCPCLCHGDEEDIPLGHHPRCLWRDPNFA